MGVVPRIFIQKVFFSIYIWSYNFIQTFTEIRLVVAEYIRMEEGMDGHVLKPMTPSLTLKLPAGRKTDSGHSQQKTSFYIYSDHLYLFMKFKKK